MAVEQFLDFSGIVGESTAPDARDHIPVLSWSFEVGRSPGEQLGLGRAEFSDFTFTKIIDSTTPLLLTLLSRAVTTSQVRLLVRTTGQMKPRVVVDMRDVAVAAVSARADAPLGELVETVRLRFAKVWFGAARADRGSVLDQTNWFSWDVPADSPAS
ncbi:MAG: type VI secretion system tube protein Hcp [Acidimicrobiales bacterium]